MESKYDCTEDVLKHSGLVSRKMFHIMKLLLDRAMKHDFSKLLFPEKPIFDEYVPKLRELKFGSPEYDRARNEMGEGLKHHYENNRHHPEHFENGINGMTLVDLVEMFCDWVAASENNGVPINMDYLSERFSIPDTLKNIFINTLKEI